MSKPVEIEFLMKDGLSSGIDKAREHIDSLVAAAKQAPTEINIKVITDAKKSLDTISDGFKEIDRVVDTNKTAIRELEAEYKRLAVQQANIQAKGGGKADEYNALAKQRQVIRENINLRKNIVTEATKQADELLKVETSLKAEAAAASAAAEKHSSLRHQIRQLSEEMVQVGVELGKESKEYQAMAVELGRLKDIQGDIQQAGKVFANDEAKIAGVISGLNGLTGAFAAAQGAVGLFAGENENLNKIMLKVQSLMSITMGLQQVQQVLNEDSAFRLTTLNGLKKWWNSLLEEGVAAQTAETAATEADTVATTQNTVAETANAAAKQASATAAGRSAAAAATDVAAKGAETVAAGAATTANIGLAGAFRMVGAAIKSIPVWGWVLAAVAAVAGVIASVVSKAAAAKKAANDAFNAAIKKQEEFNKAVADKVADQIVTYKKMSNEYKALGNNMKAQKKFINDNKDAFHGLGVNINTVNQANSFLVRNSKNVINALMAQARAAAAFDMAKETQRKLIQKELDPIKYKVVHKTDAEAALISQGKGTVVGAGSYARLSFDGKDVAATQKQLQQQELQKSINHRNKEKAALNKRLKKYLSMVETGNEDFSSTMKDIGVPTYNGHEDKPKKEKKKKEKKDDFDYGKALADQQKAQEEYKSAREKLIEDAEKQITEFNLNAMQAGLAKEIQQIQAETEQKKRAWEEQLKQLAITRQKTDKEYYMAQKGATEAGWAKTENGKKTTDDYIKQLLGDPEISKEYYRVLNGYVAAGEKQISDVKKQYADERLKAEDEMIDKYGSVEEKAEKIKRDWQKKLASIPPEYIGSALDQMHEELSKLSSEKLKDSINWGTVFNDLDKLSTQALEKLKGKLQNYLSNTPDLPLESIKEITTKIHDIEGAIDKEKDKFGILLPSLQEYKRLKAEAADAQERLNAALRDQATAELGRGFNQRQISEELTKNGVNVDASQISSKNKGELLAGIKDQKALVKLNKLFGELTKSEKKVAKTTEASTKARNEAEEAEDKAKLTIKEKAAIVAEAFDNLGSKLESLSGIIDQLGLGDTGIGKTVKNVSDGVSSAAGAAADYASGNYLGAAMKGLSAIKSFGSALGIGGGNAAEVAKKMAELTASNEALKVAIEGLTEKMNDANGAESIDYYKRAKAAQERSIENYRKILDLQVHYTSAHHSDAHYWNLSQASVDEINWTLGTKITRKDDVGQFLQLTPQQMNDIRTMLPDIWGEMLSQGKYGKKGFHKQYWNDYADQYNKLDELTKQINEKLLGLSFDGLRDDFVSKLQDMKSDVSVWSKDINKTMNDALIKSMFSNKGYEKRLKDWYNKLAEEMQNAGGTLTDKQIDNFKAEYDRLVKEAISIREQASRLTGYKDETGETQSGKTGGFAAMTQDQGTKLEGIFVSGLQHWSAMDKSMENVSDKMSLAENHLAKIEEHTGNSEKHLSEIKEDIKKIVRDGIKTV